MPERPRLLLNPWAVRSTETGEQVAAGGGAFGRKVEEKPGEGGRGTGKDARAAVGGDFVNLDFLGFAEAA